MTRTHYILIGCLLLMFATACSNTNSNSSATPATATAPSPVERKITSESVVKAVTQSLEISAGESAEAVVRIIVEKGYHVNANPPTYPYLKATTLELKPVAGITIGLISYPKAIDKKFPFAEKPLAVYEGETEVKATLKTEKSAKKGGRSIAASLRIQACDEQVCYAPGTLELAIPVTIN